MAPTTSFRRAAPRPRTIPSRTRSFCPQELFPRPLAWTWSDTQGADLSWIPVPFQRSFRMAYSRTHYGTGYYIYHQYVPGANLSRPLHAWDGTTPPDADVLKLIARAGSDLVPRPDSPDGKQAGVREEVGKVALPARKAVTLVRLTKAPAMLRAAGAGRAEGVGAGVFARPAPRHLGRPGTTFHRRTRRSLFRHRDPVQPRRPGVPRERLPHPRPGRRQAGSPGLLFPHALLPLGPHRAGRSRRRKRYPRFSGVCATRPTTTRPTTSRISTPPTPTIPGPSPARTWSCSTPARSRGVRNGPATWPERRSSSRTRPTSPRWRATRASSSTTVSPRRPRAPGRRSGAAAATTGAGAT